jgi:hypothetical protein
VHFRHLMLYEFLKGIKLPLHQKICMTFTEKELYQMEPVISDFQDFMRAVLI